MKPERIDDTHLEVRGRTRSSCRPSTAWGTTSAILVLSLASVASAQVHPRVLTEAFVEGKNIRLSDVLSSDSPSDSRRLAEGLVLGDSPRLGSVREFSREQIERILVGEPFPLANVEVPPSIRVERKAWPIAPDLLQAALQRFLLAPAADRTSVAGKALNSAVARTIAEDGESRSIQVAAGASKAASPRASVEAYSARCELGQRRLQVRLRCPDRALCADFMVAVTDAKVVATRCARSALSRSERTLPLIAAGSKATLYWQSGSLRLSLPVVCLEPGSLGQMVRVLDANSHRVLRAQVTGARELKAVS